MLGIPLPLPIRLARLEEALSAPAPDRRALGSPGELASLFPFLLAGALRRGTDLPGLSPCAILEAARRAAAEGALPLSTVAALRRMLEDAARQVREAGAWDEAAPLWWEPLPAPSPAEAALSGLLGEPTALELPAAEKIAAAFQGTGARRWLRLPDLLPADLVAAVGGEATSRNAWPT